MGTTDPGRRMAPLEMTPEAFREAGHRLVHEIAEFLGSLPGRPVAPDETPGGVRRLLPAGLPEEGAEATTLLAQTAPLVFDHSAFNGHPRFFGYIRPRRGDKHLALCASDSEGQSVFWLPDIIYDQQRSLVLKQCSQVC